MQGKTFLNVIVQCELYKQRRRQASKETQGAEGGEVTKIHVKIIAE